MPYRQVPVRVQVDDKSEIYMSATIIDDLEEVAFEELVFRSSEIVAGMGPLLTGIKQQLIALSPDSIELSAQLGLAVKSGKVFSIIADGEASTSLTVTLKWGKED